VAVLASCLAFALTIIYGGIQAMDRFWDSVAPSPLVLGGFETSIPIPLYYLAPILGFALVSLRRTVGLDALTPTQSRVYTDELEGRSYELEQGLAEPLVVIDAGGRLLLADGHHRVKAASRLGVQEMDAYVIVVDGPVDLGMARTARESDLEGIDDIEEVDYAHHPLVEAIERLQDAGPRG